MKREDAERLVEEAVQRANDLCKEKRRKAKNIDEAYAGNEAIYREQIAAAILAAVAERDREWRAALSEFAKTYHMDTLPWCIEDFSEGWPDRQPEEPADE